MATGAKRHTHKYERDEINAIWCCALANCSHYMPKNVKGGSVEGKNSICWKCASEFTLDADAMTKIRPWCQACRLAASGMSPDVVAEFLVKKELEQKQKEQEDKVIKNKDGDEIEVFDPLA